MTIRAIYVAEDVGAMLLMMFALWVLGVPFSWRLWVGTFLLMGSVRIGISAYLAWKGLE